MSRTGSCLGAPGRGGGSRGGCWRALPGGGRRRVGGAAPTPPLAAHPVIHPYRCTHSGSLRHSWRPAGRTWCWPAATCRWRSGWPRKSGGLGFFWRRRLMRLLLPVHALSSCSPAPPAPHCYQSVLHLPPTHPLPPPHPRTCRAPLPAPAAAAAPRCAGSSTRGHGWRWGPSWTWPASNRCASLRQQTGGSIHGRQMSS